MSKVSRVQQWNTRCNNTAPDLKCKTRKQVLLNQLARLEEEVKETREAIEGGRKVDNVELLDGMVDCQVVLDGLVFLSNLPVEDAFDRVMTNNDLKYTTDYEEAQAAVEHHGADRFHVQEFKEDNGVFSGEGVFYTTYYSVHRNTDNKICKLLDHPRVELKDLVENAHATA